MEAYRNKTELIKLWLAVGLCIFGCTLLIAGFIVAPAGIIHQSVLIAFGEIMTFAGAILGINYMYQSKVKYLEMKLEREPVVLSKEKDKEQADKEEDKEKEDKAEHRA